MHSLFGHSLLPPSTPDRTYSRARRVLEQYQHMPSFHGIQGDCSVIVTKLISSLKKRMDDERSSTATVVETVDLLLELDQPPSDLCQQFLAKWVVINST